MNTEIHSTTAPDYKFKFEALIEHCKKQDREIAELRYELNVCRMYSDNNVWFWQGDSSDNLPTIACPVVINAGDLRSLINNSAPPQAEQL